MKITQPAKAPHKNPRTVDTDGQDKDTEDARMAIAGQFYLGAPNTSPHSQGPSINSEAFLFLKSIFRRRPRDKSRF